MGEPSFALLRGVGVRRHGVVQGRRAHPGVRGDRARTRWRWASRSRCSSRDRSEPSPTQPRPVDPAELGFEAIVYEKAPPRATIRLNRPDVLNAFDFRMLREIARACEDASWDDEIRVVVVTGTGRAFCVGADLRTLGRDARRQAAGVLEVVRRLQGHARPAARARQADDRARSTGSRSAAATSCRWRATCR